MVSNYFRYGFRILARSPLLSAINILGLTIGITSFYILFPYAQAELNTDHFHQDYQQIGRLAWHYRWTDDDKNWNEFYHPLNNTTVARMIADEFPQIKELVTVAPREFFSKAAQGFDRDLFFTRIADGKKTHFREDNTVYADPNFFTFFSFPIVDGNPSSVLSSPGSAAISERTAIKLFSHDDPRNQTIYLNDSIPIKITGVFKDLPRNTHLKADIVLSTAGLLEAGSVDLPTGAFAAAYIKVDKGVDFEWLETEINKQKKHFYGECDQCDPSVSVQTLDDIIFENLTENPFTSKSKLVLQILRAMAFVILAQAWINYICMSIGRMRKRLVEIGARKIAGATWKDFFAQFIIEALMTNLMSVAIAFTVIQLLNIPLQVAFDFYTPSLDMLSGSTIVVIVATIISGIFITGIYPVLASRRTSPVELLRKLRTVEIPWWMRSLVTFQYASAIVLLVSIATIYFQLNFILNRDLGIDRNGIAVFDAPFNQSKDFDKKFGTFMNIVGRTAGVSGATVCKYVPGDNMNFPFWVKRNAGGVLFGFDCSGGVDENFVSLYSIKILAGRNFGSNLPADRRSIMISESASQRLGFASPEECVGQKLILPEFGVNDVQVVAVYEDYEFRPFFSSHQATGRGSVLTYKTFLAPGYSPSKISVKINLGDARSVMGSLEAIYKKIFPEELFRWSFLDKNIEQHYQVETRARNQIVLFTFLAISISCIGLFGVMSNKIGEKTKEIGIRKVLGAKAMNIVRILLHSTIRQLVVATVIAIPLSYYLSEQYLEKYSLRITLHWFYYIAPVLLLMSILFSSVFLLLIRAVRTNPVESLRSES